MRARRVYVVCTGQLVLERQGGLLVIVRRGSLARRERRAGSAAARRVRQSPYTACDAADTRDVAYRSWRVLAAASMLSHATRVCRPRRVTGSAAL
eukprot:4007809-Pleurochrysis_carterae.AAC.3